MNKHSEILEDILLFIYPLIIVFGIYIIFVGNNQPGGGFQGGAILVAVFMSRYLVFPDTLLGLDYIKKIDKVILVIIILLAMIYIMFELKKSYIEFMGVYNILMGILIGFKVTCGLSIIFYTFVNIEGGEEE